MPNLTQKDREWWERALKMRVERLDELRRINAPITVIQKEKELIAKARRALGQH